VSPHPTVAAFPVEDGELVVGGMRLSRLAARVGSTPFFAYDRGLLSQRVGRLRACLPPGLRLSYAVKANPMPAVVQHLAGLLDGLDVASAQEMRVALDTPTRAADISFAGPGKSVAEIEQAVAAGVLIEMESGREAGRVEAAGRATGVRPRVAVRVNPDFHVKGSGMRMGGGPQQFGVDSEQVPTLLKELRAMDLDVVGFHVFAGSQNLRTDVLCQTQRQTAELALRLADEGELELRHLNLGGGFGIPYLEKDTPIDLPAIGENLHDVLAHVVRPRFPDARIGIELGRYLVGEAGIYVTRVVDRKESRGQVFLVVDGGLHHQLAASGHLGQVIRRNYPVVSGTLMDRPAAGPVSVVGCLCTPLDLLADKVDLPATDVGDLVVVFQAGAYGLTASPTAFLSHPTPVEVLV
jgi:diaminopimelate decarboxylase